jgi:superfamily II DNA or RNA helicase
LEDYDQFRDLVDFPRNKVNDELIDAARAFKESSDMEELLLKFLSDPNRTPHGPVEIADILTMQLSRRKELGVTGIILKGRSFATITPANISHQVFRLRRLSDLKYALLGHVGNILDEAKEQFIHTAEDLRIDYTIVDVIDFARLAVVSGTLCPRDAKKIQNGQCDCGYRVRGDRLNFLQKDALARLTEDHALKQEAGVVVMPTGSGKTRIAAVDSFEFKSERILYVAHTHEILDGAAKEFSHVFGADAVYDGFAFDSSIPKPSIHLTTIQLISRHIDSIGSAVFDYVIIDEFHHAAAKSYRSLISQIKPLYLLGLTATPFRGDRQDVIELCNGNVIVSFELRTGIDGKILVPYHYYGCFDSVDYSTIPYRATGYSVRDLNKALIIPERDKAIINKWNELASNLSTLAFCCSRKHAIRMSDSFNEAGINAACYLGTTPMDVRSELVEQLRYGELKVLCVVDVLNEGVDIPFVECLLFLRPTESKRIFFQQLGRGLRKSPGKENVIVLDFIGNFYNSCKIVEYTGLVPEEYSSFNVACARSSKEIINLPIGCEVHFDERVIELFAGQILDPLRATRHNIAQILIFFYRKTSRSLGHPATKREVDRIQLLHAGLYKLVFSSWKNFALLMLDDEIIAELTK